MAFRAVSDGVIFNSIDIPSKICNYTLGASFYDAAPLETVECQSFYSYSGGSGNTPLLFRTGPSDTFGYSLGAFAADANYTYYAHAYSPFYGAVNGSNVGWKTQSIAPTTSDPTYSNVQPTTADIQCYFYPNTFDSTATVWLEYKKQSDSTWTQAGASGAYSGYSEQLIQRSLSGLSSSTVYNFRLQMTRNSTGYTTLTSNTASFTTAAGSPTITTNAATNVASTTATLNGTINPNNVSSTYYFEWGLTTGYGNTTASQGPSSGSSDIPYSQAISGLTSNGTTYHFRAVADYSGSKAYGADQQFQTASDPGQYADKEDHVTIFDFNERKYGVQSDFYFTVASPSATSSDRFFNAATPFVTGDIQISKDGGAFANVDTGGGSLPSRVGTTAVFKQTLTATQMQASTIIVQIVDQNGPAFRDAVLVIRTKQEIGQLSVDATQIGGNTNAIEATGVGTGADISGVLGSMVLRKSVLPTQTGTAGTTVTLDSGANATNDYYAGCLISIISGTGVGQSRVCIAYDGTNKWATLDGTWLTNPVANSVAIITPGARVWDGKPSAELSGVPSATDTYGKKLQFLFQRFCFRITQTATTQTWYKDNSSSTLGTRSVSDDLTTQDLGHLA